VLWCSTTANYFEDREWGFCDVRSCGGGLSEQWRAQLPNMNTLVAALLILEAVPALVAHGLVLGHNAYLRSVTNQLDFVVLLTNIADLAFSLLLTPDPEQEQGAGLALSRDVVRCFRALRALRLLRITTKFSIMRNMLFLLGRIKWSLIVSTLVNSIFMLACTLVAQELWNSSLHFGCYSTATGIREWPPRKCDPAAPESLRSGGGFNGGLHGRKCPPGSACIPGKEAANGLEHPTVTAPVEGGARAPVGLEVSFSEFRKASLTTLSAFMLDKWMMLAAQTVEAVGPSSILFAVVLLLAGPFFTQQLFIATMAVQLEKLHDKGYV